MRESDSDTFLDLQPLVDLCYRNGGFDDIDDRSDPPVPLPAEDVEWDDGILRAAGMR